MQDAIAKADVLIEALHWIRRFRDKVTVIKIGGRVIDDADALRHLLLDVVFMETVGMRPVIVHGGGAAITRKMEEAGLEPKFIDGRRYTDDATLAIVEQVLAYETNTAIADKIEDLGGRAAPLNFHTTCALQGEVLKLKDADGNDVDLGHVGTVTKVDRSTIENLCYANIVPVIPSMCWGPNRTKLNVNADTAATAIAQAIGAEKMVYLSDVNGVRQDKNDPNSLIPSLRASEARKLIADGVTDAGMIPKLEACLETLERGVKKVHIVDGRLRHSLLLEVYTTSGVGTEIARDE